MRRGRYLPFSIISQAGGFSTSASLRERSRLGFRGIGRMSGCFHFDSSLL